MHTFQRVIQVNTLEDRSVNDKNQWDSALKFMETAVKDRLEQSKSFPSVIRTCGGLKWSFHTALEPPSHLHYYTNELRPYS